MDIFIDKLMPAKIIKEDGYDPLRESINHA